MTHRADSVFGPDGLPLTPPPPYPPGPRWVAPGDTVTTKHGTGTVCGTPVRGIPEITTFPVRYPDGHIRPQIYDGSLFTVDHYQTESVWPMKYLHRAADLLFTWNGGARIEIRRGDSYRWKADYEGFSLDHPATDGTAQWVVTLAPTQETFKEACDAYVRALPGGRAPDPGRAPCTEGDQ